MASRASVLLAGGACLLFSIGVLYGQNRSGTDGRQPLGSGDDVQPSNIIGKEDLLSVIVHDNPDLSRKVRVASDGKIRLPLLTNAVEAAGLMPDDVANLIATELRREELLLRPSVSVSVLQYSSRPISVAGEVKHPLTFDASGRVTLLSAITRAEGMTPEAGPDIVVVKPGKDGDPYIQTVKVKELMDGSHPELNTVLKGGEEIRVSRAPKVFVVGNVKKPGSYTVQDTADLTVLKIISLCEGVLPFTAKDGYIYRTEPDGERKEIPIQMQAIAERKAPDVPLQGNDLLYVRDNKSRRLTLSTLDKIVSFGASTASGVLIWHR